MNKSILIVLGGAVAVAMVVAILVQVSLGSKEEPIKVVEEKKVQVLVASRDLGIGRDLQEGDLRWQEWPEGSLFGGAVVREDDMKASEALTGRLRRGVSKGEPVLRSAILGESKGNFVAASLEAGMRAVAIKVSAESMVGGFIGPGDFVDVILTYRESIRTQDDSQAVQTMIELNLDQTATETILQNVKVLAVDQTATRGGEDDEKIKVGKTVTLGVTAQDAEKLTLAAQIGALTLALRGIGDDKILDKDWQTISDARLTNIGDEVYGEYNKIKKDTGINPNIVRIYNGGQVLLVPAQ